MPKSDLDSVTRGKMAYAKRLVNALDRAVRDHAFIGAQRPEEHRDIEDSYVEARKELLDYIEKILTR